MISLLKCHAQDCEKCTIEMLVYEILVLRRAIEVVSDRNRAKCISPFTQSAMQTLLCIMLRLRGPTIGPCKHHIRELKLKAL